VVEIGFKLKEARESRGLTLEKVEEETKIRKKYILAMEQDQFQLLPGPIYARAFLKNYARYLNINPEEILDVLKQVHPSENDQAETHQNTDNKAAATTGIKRHWLYPAAALLIIIMFVFLYYGTRGMWETRIEANNEERHQTGEIANQGSNGQQANVQDNTGQQDPVQDNAASISGVKIMLNVKNDRSWISVDVDGKQLFQGEIQAGEAKSFEGKENILITLGNAGAVEVLENGKSLGFLGAPGEVVEREFKAPASQ
jgi:transcriptional regulator with XRE-family HTH domain